MRLQSVRCRTSWCFTGAEEEGCQAKGLEAERVKILEKMGKWRDALDLQMVNMHDIDAAIALVQRQAT